MLTKSSKREWRMKCKSFNLLLSSQPEHQDALTDVWDFIAEPSRHPLGFYRCWHCVQTAASHALLFRDSITYKQWLSEIFLFLFRNLWLFGDRWTQIPACWFKCHFSSDTVIFVEKIVWVILHCQVWAMTLKMITLNFINHLPVMKAVNGDSKSRCFCPNVDDCFALK